MPGASLPSLSSHHVERLGPYLPPHTLLNAKKPWVTLTYATSLDGYLSAAPGTQTLLSGPESKTMTHFLRSQHDAIIVGAGTALTDDPTLNCRIEDTTLDHQPRPVILDRRGRWTPDEKLKVLEAAREGMGKAPWVVRSQLDDRLETMGLKQVRATTWSATLEALANEGVRSIMVEGGARVINDLVREGLEYVDSIIVTVAPVYLGEGGVEVTPGTLRFTDVTWLELGNDGVMCVRPTR